MKKSDMTMEQPQIDLGKTVGIDTENGGKVWQQGFILRKVSRFITNSAEDAVLPIPIFYDPETGKILEQGLPPELREEYDTI
jgi:hypothetical protein